MLLHRTATLRGVHSRGTSVVRPSLLARPSCSSTTTTAAALPHAQQQRRCSGSSREQQERHQWHQSLAGPVYAPLALGVAATAASLLAVLGAPAAAHAAFALPGFGAPEAPQLQQSVPSPASVFDEEQYDEYLVMPAMKDFAAMLQRGDEPRPQELAAMRLKLGFQRDALGRVSLRTRQGEWYSVKADMQAPGFLLLQDSVGYVSVLPPDEQYRLLQIDLSDDLVVAELFGNSAWQDVMVPMVVADASGKRQGLQMTEEQFRMAVSLVTNSEYYGGDEDIEQQQQQMEQAPQMQ